MRSPDSLDSLEPESYSAPLESTGVATPPPLAVASGRLTGESGFWRRELVRTESNCRAGHTVLRRGELWSPLVPFRNDARRARCSSASRIRSSTDCSGRLGVGSAASSSTASVASPAELSRWDMMRRENLLSRGLVTSRAGCCGCCSGGYRVGEVTPGADGGD